MAAAGFVEPDSGRIQVNGRDILDLPPEKRDLGVVFQNYALFPHLNVFENIAFPLRMRKWAAADIAKAVKRVLEIVSLEAFVDRKVTALSGGQQQRVALARALVFEPPVLLMDEPLGALDRSLRDQLQTEIKRIQRDLGVTVLYVTHDQEEALALSDRIAVMADGKICQLGTPDEIYERPATAFVASFVGDSNRINVVLHECEQQYRTVAAHTAPDIPLLAADGDGIDNSDAVMMVRPEAIELTETKPAAGVNAVPGTIEVREFLGASVRFNVSTPLGPMNVRKGRVGSAAAFRPGNQVWASWQAGDSLLFPLVS
jgi:putative spermidine/putrescine transport system ATP-binding protein